jgi:hypothetical protein
LPVRIFAYENARNGDQRGEHRESQSRLSHATSRAGDGTIDRPINRSRVCDSFCFLITMDSVYHIDVSCNVSKKRSVATEKEARRMERRLSRSGSTRNQTKCENCDDESLDRPVSRKNITIRRVKRIMQRLPPRSCFSLLSETFRIFICRDARDGRSLLRFGTMLLSSVQVRH